MNYEIKEIHPAEMYDMYTSKINNSNYLFCVLLEEDTQEYLKLKNRLFVFKNIEDIKLWLNRNNWNWCFEAEGKIIRFKSNNFYMEYFGNIFLAVNYLDINTDSLKIEDYANKIREKVNNDNDKDELKNPLVLY
jgi:hypothetical protein